MSAIVRASTAEIGGLELAGELTLFLWDGALVPDAATAREVLRRHGEKLQGESDRFGCRPRRDLPGLLDYRRSRNLLTTVGLQALSPAMTWIFSQNQNASFGSPMAPQLTTLQSALSAGTSYSSLTVTALSQPLPGGSILSLGYPAFQSPLATIQTVISAGTLYSALACSALTQSIAAGVPLVISGYAGGQSTQVVVTTTAAVAANATSIAVQPFTSPATFSSLPTVLQQAQTVSTSGMALGGATTIAVQPFTSNGWGVGTSIAQTPSLANIWGAVGTGSMAPALGNTALQAEIGRAILSDAATFASQVILDFFLGLSVGNGTITEAGVVLNGGLTQPTLTSALAIGQQYSSLSVTALADAIPSGVQLIIGYGSGQTQTVTTTAAAALGTTSISVSSFTANANYGGGTTVAYLLTAPTPAAGGPWSTLLDRTVLAVPMTKTPSQTATLELDLGFSN